MGKLAERYADAARSGVYRVDDASVPRAAAGEARALLLEASAAALADGGWARLRSALADPAPACVALIGDAASFAAQRAADYAALLAALESATRLRRDAGRPFFAVLVDPCRALALPALYKEER